MRKILCFLILTSACLAQSTTIVPTIEGDVLHTIQNAWRIADSTTAAGDEPSALGVDEMTKLAVDAIIAADSSGDGEISIFPIPSKWNAMRFRGASVDDEDDVVHTLYLGTLGGDRDCDLDLIGVLTWDTGLQQSMYSQITFTDGGTYVPQIGDTVTGNTSGETAVIVEISALSSGAWADGDAAGTITYKSDSGAFTNSETISIKKASTVLSSDAYTHAASDLVDFLLAQSVVLSGEKTWSAGTTWRIASPGSDEVAEARLDVTGADILVVVTTGLTSVDGKLLVKGY